MTPNELATEACAALSNPSNWPPCELLKGFDFVAEIPVRAATCDRIVKLEYGGHEFLSTLKDGYWVDPVPWPTVYKVACYDQEFGERDCKDDVGVRVFFDYEHAQELADDLTHACPHVMFWVVKI